MSILFSIILSFYTYPIETVYLNNLCDRSDFIVEAMVERVTKVDVDDGIREIATLRVIDDLNDNIDSSTIDVITNPMMICPAPPRFKKGSRVLTFLTKNDVNYYVTGLTYGVKYFEELSELFEMKERIIEYQKISKAKKVDSTQIVNWIIENFQYESLSEESMAIINGSVRNNFQKFNVEASTFHLQQNVFPVVEFWQEEHKDIIRRRLLEGKNKSNYCSPKLLRVLYDPEDAIFTDFIILNLCKYLFNESLYSVVDIILELEPVKHREELGKIRQEIIKLYPYRENKTEIIELGMEYYNLIKLE